ncbi:unnamed protein product [Calicophoron daubneyi]|uniref:TGS domain-containing protein n=1 Tax=Calicophoron daubneyi TaxID=300641 RepID=A0AAV2TC29_CALDB
MIRSVRFVSVSLIRCKKSSLSTSLVEEHDISFSSFNNRLDAWVRAKDKQQRSWMSPHTEKINVEYVGKIGPKETMKMTKGISAPVDCAKHLSQLLVEQSAIALVNSEPWDMHRPLLSDCSVQFVHFKDAHNDPALANWAFWRSASFLLAATLETAFHSEHKVRVLSIPPVRPESGGFVCDVCFRPSPTHTTSGSIQPWIPSQQELRALSAHGQRLAAGGLDFVPLDVQEHSEPFTECFRDEPYRRKQILAEFRQRIRSNGEETEDSNIRITLYRLGGFVEACAGGPLITSTRLIGRFAVTSFTPLGWLSNHKQESSEPLLVYRVQGLAIPTAFLTHFTTFDRLMQWSREPNTEVPARPDYLTPL